jgi:hypothetical protein
MENQFEEQGIEFKIITEDMIESVCDFMWENFFPDEPIARSLNVTRNRNIDDGYIKDAIKDGSSMAALDKDGIIIGVRLGKQKKKSQWLQKIFERAFMTLPYGLMYCIYGNRLTILLKLLNLVGYDVWKMFEQLGSDQIYEDAAVCTARGSRMKGLGTELCMRTDLFAKEQGCTHTYAFISGN